MHVSISSRRILGWLIAVCYAIVGARRKAIARYNGYGSILSIFGHESRPDILEPIVKYLIGKGFTFVSTDDLLEMKAGQKEWHPKLAWLTYDDGWAGLCDLIPVLEKYHVPVTVFVSPAETDRRQAWSKHVQSGKFAQGERTLFDFPAKERYALIDGDVGSGLHEHELAGWDELHRFAKHPLVTIENHTNSHLSCSHRPIDEVVAEVTDARIRLQKENLSKSRLVCYPFGHRTDEVDKKIAELDMVPVRSDAGIMELQNIGGFRNAFHQHVTVQENISRILGAWPKSRMRYV